MRNILLSFILLANFFLIRNAHAQHAYAVQDFFDRSRLEVGVGWHSTMAPTKNVSSSEFSSFNTFYAGWHYELNEEWGVRGTYAYHSFEHKDFSIRNLTMHKLMLEVTYSVSSAFPVGYYYSKSRDFDLLLHAGIGASLLIREVNSGDDFIKNLQIGVMPQYMFSDRVAIQLDILYVLNVSQNYTFSGVHLTPDGRTEGFITATIGLSIGLGGR